MNIIDAQKSLQLVTEYACQSLSSFRVVTIKKGETSYETIKINRIVTRFLQSILLFCSSKYRQKQSISLIKAINDCVSYISEIEPSHFIAEGKKTDLFNLSQRFNQAIAAASSQRGSVFEQKQLQLIRTKDQSLSRELAPLQSNVVDEKGVDTVDQPHKVGVHYRYPDDKAPHDLEALRIFRSTQAERIGALFCKRYRYFNGKLQGKDICITNSPLPSTQTQPSSYWVGHSTCFMSVPVKQENGENIKTINILTDPVEGNLNALLYPRKTKPGRKIEELPAIHIMLLSHNHLDHYSEATIKKLLIMQPTIVVPEGDGKLFIALGFKNVHEQKWWEKATIELKSGEETYKITITAIPSHHWAGQGVRGAGSYFVGHVIQGAACKGDIYYAGDTARLNPDHIKKLCKNFNIQWMYQPGGPDETRSDMESTHQASVDSLWMHTELFLKRELANSTSIQDFLKKCSRHKTILMHTSTFKLGNLHINDTQESLRRVLEALQRVGTPCIMDYLHRLKPYEQKVLDELCDFKVLVERKTGESFTFRNLADILQEGVFLPKIGARIDFEKEKPDQKEALQF